MSQTITRPKSDIETATIRAISMRLIPFLVMAYFFAYLDRVNLGFAALTMNAELKFSPTVFGWGAGIFFIGYFIFEVPSNLALEGGIRRGGRGEVTDWLAVIPGRAKREPGISRFRVWSCGASRNDGFDG